MNNFPIKILEGKSVVDDRGITSFVHDFNPSNYKRKYTIKNHTFGYIRAWHGHKIEEKAVHVVSGSILLALVKIDNWSQPSKDLHIHTFYLSALNPSILIIPPGFANGFINLSEDALIDFYSSLNLDDSKNDDFRFPYDHWNPWNVDFR